MKYSAFQLLLLLGVLGVLAVPVSAADASRQPTYDAVTYSGTVSADQFEQRRQYLDAIHLIQTSQFSRLQKLKPLLRTYPLYPYLEYTEMAYRISRHTEADIVAFIEQYQDTPLTEPLLQHWLLNLAKRGEWPLFLKYYDRISATKELKCHYGTALIKTGQTELAMRVAEELWIVAYSQPDECDPIFLSWRNGGGITPAVAWARFSLSVQDNNKSLATYLLRFVDKKDKTFASNYLLVRSKPETITRIQTFSEADIRNREIVLYGVNVLARVDPPTALETLRRYASIHNFDPDELEQTYAKIGIRLSARSGDLTLLENLPVNLRHYPNLIEARLRQSIKLGDWSNVIILANLLPKELQESSRWQYWKARVLSQSSEANDRFIATEIFQRLAEERSFYGFMSADILQSDYNFEDEPAPATMDQILSLEKAPGIQRALELLTLGERARARREWYFATANYSLREREIAAQVALRWGWYKAAIHSMIEADAWNHLDFRFPIAYQDNFLNHARRTNIPVQWGLAIARQESAFMPDAKSPSGALGVMQLMPPTAASVAKKVGVTYANNNSLLEPDLNIKLGTHYLGEMLRRFDGNRILASAAYNAGPGNLGKWLNPTIPFDAWIEIIPFTETRNYVQNVLMFSSIYSRRMNDPQPLIYPHESASFAPRKILHIEPAPVRIANPVDHG